MQLFAQAASLSKGQYYRLTAQIHRLPVRRRCSRRRLSMMCSLSDDAQEALDDYVRHLQISLATAVQAEDYYRAAQLRDFIRQLDPAARAAAIIALVKQQLHDAVEAEHYQDAAILRDRLLQLLGDQLEAENHHLQIRQQHIRADADTAQQPQPALEADIDAWADPHSHHQHGRHPTQSQADPHQGEQQQQYNGAVPFSAGRQPSWEAATLDFPPLRSETVTNGIRVIGRSCYVPSLSRPSCGRYVFLYTIRITNESEARVQLRRRSWVITDALGRTQEAGGPCVGGERPVLGPGESYEYDYVCPLQTPVGSMEGRFEVWHLSSGSGTASGSALAAAWWRGAGQQGEWVNPFEAAVAQFGLCSLESAKQRKWRTEM